VTLSRFVGVLQLGDQKVTLNHPLFLFFVFFPLENQVKNVQNTNHILQYVLGKLYLLRESNLENPSEIRPIFVGFIPITWSEVPVHHHQVGSSTKRRHARNGRRPCSTSSRFCLAKSRESRYGPWANYSEKEQASQDSSCRLKSSEV